MRPAGEASWLLARYAEAARERPDDAAAQLCHGNALAEAGRLAEAQEAYRRALLLRPDYAPAHYNLGNAQLAASDWAGAEAAYRAALALAPDHPGCLNNLGNALREQTRLAEAQACYRAALALQPDLYGTHNNLALTLLALHRPEQALACVEEALRLRPDYADACDTMGGVLLALDRPEAALCWFRRAQAPAGGHPHARFGEALALLALGRLGEGFAAYEARWADPRFAADLREYGAPPWLGDGDIAGRTVLVHAEQGLGDTLQFVRYLAPLRRRAARVVLEAQAPLVALLRPLADTVIAAGDPLPPYDQHVPLLSLPLAFGTELAGIPATVPYLPPPVPRAEARGPGLNVALTFAGSPDHPEDRLRSLPASLLAPIADLAGLTLHVVQRDMGEADRAWLRAQPNLRRHDDALADFTATAALLAALDLVVSVDTAVAHLAGALGLPVWILVQHAADFRWLRERDDSPWYPSARLFRQGPDRRWEPVIDAVARALRRATAAGYVPPNA